MKLKLQSTFKSDAYIRILAIAIITIIIYSFVIWAKWAIIYTAKTVFPIWLILIIKPYFPQKLFNPKHWRLLSFLSLIPMLVFITVLKYPFAWYHYTLYIIVFLICLESYNSIYPQKHAWLLSALTILALSETWELPHHLTWWLRNTTSLKFGVFLSSLRLICLPLLIYYNTEIKMNTPKYFVIALTVIPTFLFAPLIYAKFKLGYFNTVYRMLSALPYVTYSWLTAR